MMLSVLLATVLTVNALALTLPITFQVGGLIGSWLAGLVENQWLKMDKRRKELSKDNK
jgi:hypothetical protein